MLLLHDYKKWAMARPTTVSHESASAGKPVTFVLHTLNSVSVWRVKSFSTKEPETLELIENYGGAGAFFDVGANVGLNSLYYAKLFSDPVYSFEHSALNLGLLTKKFQLIAYNSKLWSYLPRWRQRTRSRFCT